MKTALGPVKSAPSVKVDYAASSMEDLATKLGA
jgi:hypothetical protein